MYQATTIGSCEAHVDQLRQGNAGNSSIEPEPWLPQHAADVLVDIKADGLLCPCFDTGFGGRLSIYAPARRNTGRASCEPFSFHPRADQLDVEYVIAIKSCPTRTFTTCRCTSVALRCLIHQCRSIRGVVLRCKGTGCQNTKASACVNKCFNDRNFIKSSSRVSLGVSQQQEMATAREFWRHVIYICIASALMPGSVRNARHMVLQLASNWEIFKCQHIMPILPSPRVGAPDERAQVVFW